jgi:GNAT superfamily N-acetyltransferase
VRLRAPDLEVTDSPAREDVQFLEDRLYDFNVAATGIDDGRLLAVFAREAGGGIVGGLYGWTWGQCCHVRTLWIDEARRKKGLGTRLMAIAEREARSRGATQMLVDTHSFQAPEFYRRLGFVVTGAYADYPRGHRQIFLRKSLARPTARTPRGRSSGTRRASREARAR